MKRYLEDGVVTARRAGYASILRSCRMVVTKKKNGINLFNCDHDEYEIAEELHELDRRRHLDFKFKMPKFTKQFREPEISEARKTDEDWIDEIN